MTNRLSDEDRRAVDLVLDRPDGESAEVVLPSPPPSPQSVQSVEKILSLLQSMPANDPPPDLAARTLRRIDQALAAMNATAVPNVAQRDPQPPI
jgi:hypothetical protein